MADYFQSSPNFVNPSYASPEQVAAQRAYADALTKRSGENVNRPAGAFANMITALTAGLERNRASDIQSQAAQSNSSDTAALISQLQHGQTVDPQTAAHLYSNPMASPEARGLVGALITPQGVKSEFGQPGYAAPGLGVHGVTPQGAFTPGYRVEQGAEGVHSNAPVPAPGVGMPGPAASPAAPRAAVPSSPTVWGDKEAVAAGLYPATPTRGSGGGGAAPVAGSPPAPAPVPNRPMTLDELAAKGREFSAQKAFTQGGADAVTNVQKSDIASSTDAPTIKRVAGVMLDDLRAHGDKMTFGPTAEWSNTIKRAAANYAPGFMKDQLESLASADSFDKMSAQLTSMLAKGGGTDAQLFNNMKSVPGSHNSKEGAEALLKMVVQVADQQQALRQATAGARTAPEYEAVRNDFYAKNPIVNPLTGNPIQQDLQKAGSQTQGFEKTATNPQTGEKVGLRNGQWVPIK